MGERVRGIDGQGIVAADQVGERRGPHEQHHEEQADGAQHMAPREERQPAPAVRGIGAGASQFVIVIDRGQIVS